MAGGEPPSEFFFFFNKRKNSNFRSLVPLGSWSYHGIVLSMALTLPGLFLRSLSMPTGKAARRMKPRDAP